MWVRDLNDLTSDLYDLTSDLYDLTSDLCDLTSDLIQQEDETDKQQDRQTDTDAHKSPGVCLECWLHGEWVIMNRLLTTTYWSPIDSHAGKSPNQSQGIEHLEAEKPIDHRTILRVYWVCA